jgi:hypothetical protein
LDVENEEEDDEDADDAARSSSRCLCGGRSATDVSIEVSLERVRFGFRLCGAEAGELADPSNRPTLNMAIYCSGMRV